MSIKKIIVIFKTHLDIGFTDFSEKVVQKYMGEFIPNSLSVAKQLRESNSDARLVWTTGSWLISEYLRTRTGKEKENIIQGIKNGDIRWHGLPFTTHTELMSSKLFEYGLFTCKIKNYRNIFCGFWLRQTKIFCPLWKLHHSYGHFLLKKSPILFENGIDDNGCFFIQ